MSQENLRFRTPSPEKMSRSDIGSSWSSISLKSISNDSEPRRKSKAQASFIVKYSKATKSPARRTSTGRSSPGPPAKDAELLSQEVSSLQEAVKHLTAQLTLERKTAELLEEKLESESAIHTSEREKLRHELIAIQETVQTWKARRQEKLKTEAEAAVQRLETCKTHIKSLTNMFIDMLEPLVKPEDDEELANEERFSLLSGIQKALISKLELVSKETKTELTSEMDKIKGWSSPRTHVLLPTLPRDCPEISLESPADFSYVKDDLALPPISYSIEYFTGQSPMDAAAPSLQSTKKLDHIEQFDASSEVFRLKQEILERIQKRILETEIDTRKPLVREAEALFEFDGEREDDLTFKVGDKIEVLEQNDSGWWVGKLHGKVGYFPHNYVRALPLSERRP